MMTTVAQIVFFSEWPFVEPGSSVWHVVSTIYISRCYWKLHTYSLIVWLDGFYVKRLVYKCGLCYPVQLSETNYLTGTRYHFTASKDSSAVLGLYPVLLVMSVISNVWTQKPELELQPWSCRIIWQMHESSASVSVDYKVITLITEQISL